MSVRVAVVIPYFQRGAGILSQAVASVFAQKGCEDFEIYVVDDESPVPPDQDLSGFDDGRIHVIRQKNKGCGAARNTGLDRLPAQIEYVALLDSDDTWSERHLANAVTALDRGYDFYFTNHYQLGQNVGIFERDHRLDVRQHRKLEGTESLYEFCGDMYDQVIMKNLMGPSTNVYNFAKFRDMRFREGFRSLGEEYCFWLDIARRGARFAFSTECEVRYGSGVNIYSGAQWGTRQSLTRSHDEILFWKLVTREYPLTDRQRRHLASKINLRRDELVLELLHQARTFGSVPKSLVATHLRRDPEILLRIVPALFGMLAQRQGRGAGSTGA